MAITKIYGGYCFLDYLINICKLIMKENSGGEK